MKQLRAKLITFLSVCAMVVACPLAASAFNEQPVRLVAHKALYTVSLVKARHDTGLQDVTGTMLFDLGDACDGWTVHQHMHMAFTYATGDHDDVTSSVVTWESKDGKSFIFNVKRTSGGKEEEAFKGRASLLEGDSTARYTYPQDKEPIALPEGTVFPMAHTKMLLEKAKAGEKLFSRHVFDGSDETGSADVSAFLYPMANADSQDEIEESMKHQSLLENQKVWPVRLAFYPPIQTVTEPDYEMEIALQENGIARSMVIDYGEFSVSAKLLKIEPGDAISCRGDK